MPHALDARINALFNEKEALAAKGEGGCYIDGKGWVGASPRYTELLYELRRLTRERLTDIGAVSL